MDYDKLEDLFEATVEEMLKQAMENHDDKFWFSIDDNESGWGVGGEGYTEAYLARCGDGYYEPVTYYVVAHREMLTSFDIIHYDEESDVETPAPESIRKDWEKRLEERLSEWIECYG